MHNEPLGQTMDRNGEPDPGSALLANLPQGHDGATLTVVTNERVHAALLPG